VTSGLNGIDYESNDINHLRVRYFTYFKTIFSLSPSTSKTTFNIVSPLGYTANSDAVIMVGTMQRIAIDV